MNRVIFLLAMAIRLSILTFLFLCSSLIAQTAEEYRSSISAEHCLSMCRPLMAATVTADGRLLTADSFDTGQCAGALDTISVLAAMRDGGKPVLGVCPAHEHTTVQWVAIFTDYAKRHPLRYREPFAVVALAALQEAYPCKK